MKLYKTRNGNQNKAGKNLYAFVLAENDEQAEMLAKEAFRYHKGIEVGEKEFIRMHIIIEDLSQSGASAVWAL